MPTYEIDPMNPGDTFCSADVMTMAHRVRGYGEVVTVLASSGPAEDELSYGLWAIGQALISDGSRLSRVADSLPQGRIKVFGRVGVDSDEDEGEKVEVEAAGAE